jgi:hypothetical protein
MVLSDSVKLSVKLFNEPLTWLRAAGCSEWATTLNQMSNVMVKGYSSAQRKQDNHDRDQGGNRSESFDD